MQGMKKKREYRIRVQNLKINIKIVRIRNF